MAAWAALISFPEIFIHYSFWKAGGHHDLMKPGLILAHAHSVFSSCLTSNDRAPLPSSANLFVLFGGGFLPWQQ